MTGNGNGRRLVTIGTTTYTLDVCAAGECQRPTNDGGYCWTHEPDDLAEARLARMREAAS